MDQEQLQQMEDSLSSAQKEVEQTLRPWLMGVEVQEAAHKRRLFGINSDIDNILADIDNLKDIYESIPDDCFNTSPIENAWGTDLILKPSWGASLRCTSNICLLILLKTEVSSQSLIVINT